MSNSQCPISGHTISLDCLRSLCPIEVMAVETTLEDKTWGNMAQAVSDEEDVPKEFLDAWDILARAFRESTRIAGCGPFDSFLDLELGFYNEELGDGGDDVEHTGGAIFLVEGVMVRTPAGEKFKDVVSFNSWSIYG